MPWETFHPRKVGNRARSGSVSIGASGSATIAADVAEEYIQDHDYVTLLFNDDEGLVGLKPSEDGYKIQRHESGSARLSVKAFLHEYGIAPWVYPLTWDKKMGILTFQPEYLEEEA